MFLCDSLGPVFFWLTLWWLQEFRSSDLTPDLANLYLRSALVPESSRKCHFVFHWLDLGHVPVLEPGFVARELPYAD